MTPSRDRQRQRLLPDAGGQRQGLVGADHGNTVASEVIGQHSADQCLPFSIQGIQWLVKHPDVRLPQKQARQGQPAPLPGGKTDRRGIAGLR